MLISIWTLYFALYFRGFIRYQYAHEILQNKESYFNNQYIPRARRVSIISRTQPTISK